MRARVRDRTLIRVEIDRARPRGSGRLLQSRQPEIVHSPMHLDTKAAELVMATSHPDIFWSKENWIPESTSRVFSQRVRWTEADVLELVTEVDDNGFPWGTIGQSVCHVLDRDRNFESRLPRIALNRALIDDVRWAVVLFLYRAGPAAPGAGGAARRGPHTQQPGRAVSRPAGSARDVPLRGHHRGGLRLRPNRHLLIRGSTTPHRHAPTRPNRRDLKFIGQEFNLGCIPTKLSRCTEDCTISCGVLGRDRPRMPGRARCVGCDAGPRD